MSGISELTLLVRDGVSFPGELQIVTEPFETDWHILRSADSIWLRKDIRALGWHIISATEAVTAHGMARTSGAAITTGLKQALHHVGGCFNAVEVELIDTKNYAWFVKARLNVQPYQVQHSPVLPDPACARLLRFHTVTATLG